MIAFLAAFPFPARQKWRYSMWMRSRAHGMSRLVSWPMSGLGTSSSIFRCPRIVWAKCGTESEISVLPPPTSIGATKPPYWR